MCLGAIYRARLEKMYYANTQKDADWIGFDDCLFYQEIAKKPEDRKLQIEQIMHKEAYDIFKEWKEKVEDIKY
jgi:tRNA(Arg) A34 adenosine deaminase TadA